MLRYKVSLQDTILQSKMTHVKHTLRFITYLVDSIIRRWGGGEYGLNINKYFLKLKKHSFSLFRAFNTMHTTLITFLHFNNNNNKKAI